MCKKLTYEYVNKFFKTHKCELLETEYINNSTKMKYKCKCNNESYISFSHFKQGKRCIKCSGNQKLTLEYVKIFFKERNCELLENVYTNSNTKMKYICICGNESSTTFDNFRSGCRCMNCSGNEKLSYNFVNDYFIKHNCELLETKYINSYTKMKYKCKNNHISSISWDNFKQGYRCIYCSGTEKFTFEFVYKYFKEQYCELLEYTYINANTKMRYRCQCQYISTISFNHFKNGVRCMTCGFKKSEKSSKKFKQYKLPSGEIRNIQGYEHLALNELVEIFNEDYIITDR